MGNMKDYFAGDPRTERQRMLAGDWYRAFDSDNALVAQRGMELTDEYYGAEVYGEKERAKEILHELLGEVGEDVYIKPPFYVDYGENIYIGARTFINFNLVALDCTEIRIGEDCMIGPNVQLLTPIHPLEKEARRAKIEKAAPITLGNNVWLGGGVIVLPGVTIGDNTVVGAGAVVTKDLPANVLAVGNPARILRSLEAEEFPPATRTEKK